MSRILLLLLAAVLAAVSAAMSVSVATTGSEPGDPFPDAVYYGKSSNVSIQIGYETRHVNYACHTMARGTDLWAAADIYRKEAIGYLSRDMDCSILPGHLGCGRVSCSYDAGVYLCADTHREIPVFGRVVAQLVQVILDNCEQQDYVKGSAWFDDRKFRVEIHKDQC
ncbi:hypothetical protein QBC46DRAFT_381438 [Diplogelasinospora grovesii]|uniref:Ecp2 effector protein domain-containing protein n=1 Tax=Diplogelasinospora grovesii TaxID=303347 RepID=A0AAN6NA42_9PEZI|nr:hypothetical protein QBC46DRAFT_381438 [Diplogelasinospora grovesii]